MARFWVDYSASVLIEADSHEEAEATFWQVYNDDTRQYCEVNDVELKEE